MSGVTTSAGNRTYGELYGPKDKNAAVIDQLIDAGAVILGRVKTVPLLQARMRGTGLTFKLRSTHVAKDIRIRVVAVPEVRPQSRPTSTWPSFY